MKQLDLSIVIVSWNTRGILNDCLSSVYEETNNVSFEVIVIDNASTDGSGEMVKIEFPQVILFENRKNRGFAAANNQGMAIARGRYILLLNSDTIVLNDAISKTIAFADTRLDAAVVGCRVLNPDKSLQPTCFMFPSVLNMFLSSTYLYKLFPKSKSFGREQMTWWNRDDVREVDVATGCFMLVRQEAIKQVGTMDERFFVYGEETDWCYRFKQAGWKVIYTPSAEIIHLGGESSKQVAMKMILLLRGSKLLFFKKHRGYLVYALACLLIVLFFILRIPYWFIRALFSSKRNRNRCLRTGWVYAKGALCALTGGRRLYRVR